MENRFSKRDVSILYNKATKYVEGACLWLDADFLRRDMDAAIGSIVRQEMQLRPRLKNTNGHKASPINGNLSGVFLQIWAGPGGPRKSKYGERQLLLPTESVLNTSEYNLYFADFYCQTVKLESRMVHYVILVVCPIGSSSDVFCKKHLRRLSWWANPFLVAKQGEAQTGFLFSRGDKGQAFYLVHLFFAEVIDLTGMQCRWRQGEMDGGGQQSLDVNSDCPHCSQQASSKQRLGARA